MTRPDAACLCIDLGIHAAITVQGEHRERLLAAFLRAHSGPGHIPEDPPRDWFGRQTELNRHLERLRQQTRAGLSAAPTGRSGAG